MKSRDKEEFFIANSGLLSGLPGHAVPQHIKSRLT